LDDGFDSVLEEFQDKSGFKLKVAWLFNLVFAFSV